MAGRSEAQKSPAFAALSVGGQRVLKVIEQAGRDGVAISLDQFMERADLCRSSVRRGIRQCELVGFVTVSIGARRCSVFALADGWRRLDAGEAKRRMKLAKEPTPPRATSAPSKPVRQAKARVEVEQPRVVRQPSMPRLAWLQRASLATNDATV
jgi:hypothetical protein